MNLQKSASVLLIGGSGLVGSRMARLLRDRFPTLHLSIAGRDHEKAKAVAHDLGEASAVVVDLSRPDLGLAPSNFIGVVTLLKDHALNAMRFAQANGIAYMLCSEAVFEIGPIASLFAHHPKSAPILLASNWMISTATLPALHFAQEFDTIDDVRIGAVFDPDDPSGPMSQADWDRSVEAVPRPLVKSDGRWIWADEVQASRTFAGADGEIHAGAALGVLDLLSISSKTHAHDVRFDVALSPSAGSRQGLQPSHDITIEISGHADGSKQQRIYSLSHPAGSAQMAATGAALLLEALLGLGQDKAAEPGLFLPEQMISPDVFMQRLSLSGMTSLRLQ
jgi:hypothetical protein